MPAWPGGFEAIGVHQLAHPDPQTAELKAAMVKTKTLGPDNSAPYQMGDENPGEGVINLIIDLLADTEDRILHHTTFDFGQKTMALTLQGIILTDTLESDDDENPTVTYATYGDIAYIEDTGHDREIRIHFHGGHAMTHRMGNAQTVAQLKRVMRSYRNQFLSNGDPKLWGTDEEALADESTTTSGQSAGTTTDEEPPPISERVRFWEEQDRINQVLIPRVIRQGELLTRHVAEHDNLPEMIGRVISDALSEQATLYNAAMERASSEMQTAYDQALDKTRQELDAQYAAALKKANAEQQASYEAAISAVKREASQTRKWAAFVGTVATLIAVVAIVIAVLL